MRIAEKNRDTKETKIYEKFVMAVNPGEMQTITINKALVKDDLKINIE